MISFKTGIELYLVAKFHEYFTHLIITSSPRWSWGVAYYLILCRQRRLARDPIEEGWWCHKILLRTGGDVTRSYWGREVTSQDLIVDGRWRHKIILRTGGDVTRSYWGREVKSQDLIEDWRWRHKIILRTGGDVTRSYWGREVTSQDLIEDGRWRHKTKSPSMQGELSGSSERISAAIARMQIEVRREAFPWHTL